MNVSKVNTVEPRAGEPKKSLTNANMNLMTKHIYNAHLELRKYKNVFSSVKSILASKLSRFFAHLPSKKKSAAVSKLA